MSIGVSATRNNWFSIHSMGHLEGGPQAVNYLFAKCVDVGPEKLMKDRLKGNPVSCPSIRKKIPHITRRAGCNCHFDFASDRYPTPVLHLLTLPAAEPKGGAPPSAAPLAALAQRFGVLDRQRRELEQEWREPRGSLIAALVAAPERAVACAAGHYRLVEREGVEELLWEAAETGPGLLPRRETCSDGPGCACLAGEAVLLARCEHGRPTPNPQSLIPYPMHILAVTEQVASVHAEGDLLLLRCGEALLHKVRAADVEQVLLFGAIEVTCGALRLLLRRQIDLVFLTRAGDFRGRLVGRGAKNVVLRLEQYRRATDPAFSVSVARSIAAGKIRNQRQILLRCAAAAEGRRVGRDAGQSAAPGPARPNAPMSKCCAGWRDKRRHCISATSASCCGTSSSRSTAVIAAPRETPSTPCSPSVMPCWEA